MSLNWQPIESAPKDQHVIVFNAVAGVHEALWVEGHGWLITQWAGQTGRWWPSPTHWMPLPEPPEGPSDGD